MSCQPQKWMRAQPIAEHARLAQPLQRVVDADEDGVAARTRRSPRWCAAAAAVRRTAAGCRRAGPGRPASARRSGRRGRRRCPSRAVATANCRTIALSYANVSTPGRGDGASTACAASAASIDMRHTFDAWLRARTVRRRRAACARPACVVSSNWPDAHGPDERAEEPAGHDAAGGDEQDDDAHDGEHPSRRPAHRAGAEADDRQRADRHQDRRGERRQRAGQRQRQADRVVDDRHGEAERRRPGAPAARSAGTPAGRASRSPRDHARRTPARGTRCRPTRPARRRPPRARRRRSGRRRPSARGGPRPAGARTSASLSSGDCRKRIRVAEQRAPARRARRRGRRTSRQSSWRRGSAARRVVDARTRRAPPRAPSRRRAGDRHADRRGRGRAATAAWSPATNAAVPIATRAAVDDAAMPWPGDLARQLGRRVADAHRLASRGDRAADRMHRLGGQAPDERQLASRQAARLDGRGGRPVVSVPVLSKTTVSMRLRSSTTAGMLEIAARAVRARPSRAERDRRRQRQRARARDDQHRRGDARARRGVGPPGDRAGDRQADGADREPGAEPRPRRRSASACFGSPNTGLCPEAAPARLCDDLAQDAQTRSARPAARPPARTRSPRADGDRRLTRR